MEAISIGHKKSRLWIKLYRYRWCFLLAAPTTLFLVVFKYLPLVGIMIAFQDYSPFRGFFQSEWVGFKHFTYFFTSSQFWILTRNTLGINMMNLILFFPLPIVLSLMLNEIRHEAIKRTFQSIVYLPHFLSWVLIVSFTYFLISVDIGIINKWLVSIGREPVAILTNPDYFWLLLTAQNIWKDVGWGTIIFLAAIAGVDPQLYEAATIDGANRYRKIWHVTLPAIRSTIVILVILRIGSMLDVGFEQILLMLNPLVLPVGEVYDTYVYKMGLLSGQFSYSTAVGIFKAIVSMGMIMSANWMAKRFGEGGLY